MGTKKPPSLVRSAKARPTPLRQWTVRRDGLLARLSAEASGMQAIVIEAPPGYGKSTVMRQWLEMRTEQGWRTAWLSLDVLDDEPGRFASLMIGAFPGLCRQSVILGSGELQEIEDVVDRLLSHDFSERPAALFIDDFHVVTNASIHRAIGRLAAQAPEGLQLVMSSRIALPMALAKARLAGAVMVLRESDLALDAAEARRLLGNICKREIDPGQSERLRHRAGGWAAMLQMAGLALEASESPSLFVDEFSGTDVEVSRYLCEVTLDLQRPEVRRLLLATSPLDMFSPELCTALTGLENARALLAEIEDRHLLLIPLDRQRRWFKYHALFREFLESRLDVDHPGEKQRLLSAASTWFHGVGEVELAVEHALRADDHEKAAAFASDRVTDIALNRGEHATVQRWISNLPGEIIDRYPSLKIGLAWAFTFRQRHAEAGRLLASVEADVQAALNLDKITEEQAAETLSTCDMIRAIAATAADRYAVAGKLFRAFDRKWTRTGLMEQASIIIGNAYTALALGRPREARRLLEQSDDVVVRSRAPYAYGWSSIVKARLALFEGKLTEVVEKSTIALESKDVDLRPVGFVRELMSACLAEAHYEANRLEEARQAMDEAGEAALGHVTVELGESASRVLARLAMASGQVEEALSILRRSIGLAQQAGLPRLVDLLGGEMATCLIRAGRLEEAFLVDQEMGLSQPTTEEFAASMDMRQLTQARLSLARGDIGRASRLVATLLNRVRSTGQVRLEISTLCIAAGAQAQLGDAAESRRLATQAKLTAAQAGFRRSVIDEDYLLNPLTERQPTPTPDFALPDVGAVGGLNGLSHREGHVLTLISQGLTNRDIAEALVLSEETVKWHMRNITKKLNARNRTHAVQIARQSGLLH
ncbi:LuxR C-terminal-related transcriptional regulator [Zavarzinia sp.]|uniref:LuxR C-terminal-related transcriptional regulator n=1 Tax=Zavarzinia sp. TaxID=2027920 RepID=UPI003BB6985F